MNNELSLQPSFLGQKPVGLSASTGLTLYQSIQRKTNDFIYSVGMREALGLHIVEAIAEGVGCTLLCGIQVREKETSKEICSIPVERGTRYSRQVVVNLVKQHLCKTIEEAAIQDGLAMDKADVERQVAKILDDCYFSESRQIALRWAERVGIISK
ncbi:MAG: hypothetical protein J6P74_08685 [Paludibacteraceae bacterium]|nr:hypothetical protein [Paludibacteraceae bacterium]